MNVKLLFLFLSVFSLHALAADLDKEPPKYSPLPKNLTLPLPPFDQVLQALQTQGSYNAYPNHDMVTASIETKDKKGTTSWTAGCNGYNLGLLTRADSVSPKAIYVSVLREAGLGDDSKIHVQAHLEVFIPNANKFWFWEKDFTPLKVFLHATCCTQQTVQSLRFVDKTRGIAHALHHGTKPQYFSASSGILRSFSRCDDEITAQYLLKAQQVTEGLPNGYLLLE